MTKNGAILVLDDDKDDQLIVKEVFQKLGYPNEVVYFCDGEDAWNYLNSTNAMPLLIISDIRMPKVDGHELMTKLQNSQDLRLRSIPYVFVTAAVPEEVLVDAYANSTQGFFVKPLNYDELENIIKCIVEYWRRCASPSPFTFRYLTTPAR